MLQIDKCLNFKVSAFIVDVLAFNVG